MLAHAVTFAASSASATDAATDSEHAIRQAIAQLKQRPKRGAGSLSPQLKQLPAPYGTPDRNRKAGTRGGVVCANCCANTSRRAATPSLQRLTSTFSTSLCSAMLRMRSGVKRERGAMLSTPSASSST